MTTDELIEKLLEGTISSTEKQQLYEQMAASPALAEEVHRLTVVEKLLTVEEEEPEVVTAAPFLRSVENSIAASIAVASQTAQVSSGGFPRMLYAPFLVLLGGIGVFLAWPSSPETPVSVQQQQQIDTPPSFSVQTPAMEEVQPSPSTTEQMPTTVRPSVRPQERSVDNSIAAEKAPEVESTPVIPPTPENSASIERSSSNTTTKQVDQLEELRDTYTAHLQQGDNVKAAIAAKSLGSLYRKQGDLKQAQTYLQSSLELSRKAHLPEYEAEALGELGLLALDNGNRESAREYISSCIELLRTSGATSSLQRWEKQLARLPN